MVKISKSFSDEELFLKVRLRSVLKKNQQLASVEAQSTKLSTNLEDLSQVTGGTKLFSDFVDIPVKKLEIGEAYRLTNIDKEVHSKLDPGHFEKQFTSVFASKNPLAPSLKCGYNVELFRYYEENVDPEYPATNEHIGNYFVQMKKYSQKYPEKTLLDLRPGFNQQLITLYVKKAEIYSSEFSDLGMFFSNSEIFGICSNSPLKTFFEKLFYYIAVLVIAVVAIYSVWVLGKRKLGDLGEMKFEREARKKEEGFEMIDSGPRNLSVITEDATEVDFDTDGNSIEDDEHGGDHEHEDHDHDFDVDIEIDDEKELQIV